MTLTYAVATKRTLLLMRATSKRRRTSRLEMRSVIYNSSPSRRNSKRLQLGKARVQSRGNSILISPVILDTGKDDSAEFATKARRGRSGRFSESIGVIWGTRREGGLGGCAAGVEDRGSLVEVKARV